MYTCIFCSIQLIKKNWSVDLSDQKMSLFNCMFRAGENIHVFPFLFEGFDQDCYRTYECLLLGTIPIVYSFAGINSLFRQTPTLMYSNWVRPALPEEINTFVPPTKSRKVIIWHYWNDQILCEKRRMRQEFEDSGKVDPPLPPAP